MGYSVFWHYSPVFVDMVCWSINGYIGSSHDQIGCDTVCFASLVSNRFADTAEDQES